MLVKVGMNRLLVLPVDPAEAVVGSREAAFGVLVVVCLFLSMVLL